jgi:hypothetical protein
VKRSIIVFACLWAALASGALPGAFRPEACQGDSLCFSVSNDAMGPGPVDEWDDLCSFGIDLLVGLKNSLALSTEYQSFTWRSDSPTTASRIDSINIALGGKILETAARGLRFASRGSLGVSLFGEFGGVVLQEGFHGTVGLARPLPVSYDPYSWAALALSLSADASLANGSVRPGLFASVDGDIPGSWRLEGGVQADIGAPGSGLAARALYRYESASGLSPTQDAVSRYATGMVVRLDIEASYLTGSMAVNLLQGVSSGAIGFRIGSGHVLDTESGIPIALEISIDFARAATGYRMLFPLFGPAVRICAGARFGWWDLPESSTTGLRSSEYNVGIEARLTLPIGQLEGELACAMEPVATIITAQPLGMERSHVQDRTVLLGVRFEPIVRLGFVEPRRGGRVRKTGLGAALALQPPPAVLLPFSAWPPVSNRTLALRVFAFGEIR